jgi:hypothetical protein
MGTSFDCPITVSAHPVTGLMGIMIGPLDMGNLAEMLDYLASDECRECVFQAATKAFTTEMEPPTVHLRGNAVTKCGLSLWMTTPDGRTVAAVASVGWAGNTENPVTCPQCLAWIAAQP